MYGDGKWLAWEDSNVITIESAKNGDMIAKVAVKTPHELSEFVLSSDAKWLATYDQLASEIGVWSVGPATETGHTKQFGMSRSTLRFAPDDSRVVWGAFDGSITLFDYLNDTTKRFCCHRTPGGVDGIAVSNDGRWLASVGEDQLLKLWSADPKSQSYRSDTPVYTLSGHTGSVRSVAFSPNDNLIVSGSDDGTATVWDRDKGAPVADLVTLAQGLGWSPCRTRTACSRRATDWQLAR